MSKYEDYDSVSKNYDSQRFAMGADIIAAMMQFYCRKPLQEIHLLDAGCGTGNYAKALLDFGLGHVTMLDASGGMLTRAREKLVSEIASGKVKDIVQAAMPPLPFPDATFDAVMFNLVLHHLEHKPDGENFPQIVKVLKEARRVLKPNGVLSVSTAPPLSVYDNIWYVHLNKDIAQRHLKQYPQDQQWQELLQKSGFQCVSDLHVNIDLPDKILNTLLDPEGPTKKEWRDTSSYWASATERELSEIINKISAMKSKGTLEQFVSQFGTATEFSVLPLYVAKPV